MLFVRQKASLDVFLGRVSNRLRFSYSSVDRALLTSRSLVQMQLGEQPLLFVMQKASVIIVFFVESQIV